MKKAIHRDEIDCTPAGISPVLAHERIRQYFEASKVTRGGLPVGCPVCGASMIVRTRSMDGRAFLGCSRYPSCGGTWDVPDEAQDEAREWERTVMSAEQASACLPSRELADEVSDRAYTKPARKSDEDIIDEVLERKLPTLPTTKSGFRQYATRVRKFRIKNVVLDMDEKFHFNGTMVLARGELIVAPEIKGAIHSKWVGDLGDSPLEALSLYNGALSRYMDRVKRKVKGEGKMHDEKEDVEKPANPLRSEGVLARVKRSSKKSMPRIARMRALKHGRLAILKMAKKFFRPAAYDLFEAFLNTDAGQGFILGAVGLGGPYVPKLGKQQAVQDICEEFLDEGVAMGYNEVLGFVGMVLTPVFQGIMSSLPGVEEVADKVVPKRKKKRVAADSGTRVVASDDVGDEDEEEESRPRRKNALRSLEATG